MLESTMEEFHFWKINKKKNDRREKITERKRRRPNLAGKLVGGKTDRFKLEKLPAKRWKCLAFYFSAFFTIFFPLYYIYFFIYIYFFHSFLYALTFRSVTLFDSNVSFELNEKSFLLICRMWMETFFFSECIHIIYVR